MERKAFASTRPQLLFCYICGREYGSKSLPIHEKQCLKKFETEQEQLPKHLRKPPPRKPQPIPDLPISGQGSYQTDRDAFNDAAYESYKENLSQCPHCGRKFAADRLPVHLRSCRPGHTAKPVGDSLPPPSPVATTERSESPDASPENGGRRPGERPRMLMCYICGREFGSKSLAIHEPQCLQKWENEQAKLPAHMRQPPPQRPTAEAPIRGSGTMNRSQMIDAMNEAAYDSYKSNLSECPNCHRRFNADRLPVHLRSCRPGHTAKPPPSLQGNDEEDDEDDDGPISPPTPEPTPASRASSRAGQKSPSTFDDGNQLDSTPLQSKTTPQQEARPSSRHAVVAARKTPQSDEFNGQSSGSGSNNFSKSAPIKESPAKADARAPGQRPRMLMCYICGREFGSQSLTIHEPQCLQKWEIEQAKLPAHMRRPPPQRPTAEVPIRGSGTMNRSQMIDAMNEAAYDSYKSNLSECPNCHRRFNADRLPVHLRSCRPGHTAKPVHSGQDDDDDEPTPSISSSPAPEPPSSIPSRRSSSRIGQVSLSPSPSPAPSHSPAASSGSRIKAPSRTGLELDDALDSLKLQHQRKPRATLSPSPSSLSPSSPSSPSPSSPGFSRSPRQPDFMDQAARSVGSSSRSGSTVRSSRTFQNTF